MNKQTLPLLTVLLLAAGLTTVQAQSVGIGTTAPDASAALDIVASAKGALLPRVASTSAVTSPATGLIVYQTGSPAGYYYNSGTAATPVWLHLQTPGDTWNLGGNTIGSAEQAFGTLDANDVPLVVNGVEQGRLTKDGHLLLGLAAPNAYVKANLATLPDGASPRLLIADDNGNGDLSLLTGGTGATPVINIIKQRGTIAVPAAVAAGDELGALHLYGYNGSGYNYGAGLYSFVESLTAGKALASLSLSVNATEAVHIMANRNVGLGTGSPSQLLELGGQAAPTLLLHSNTNSVVTGATLQFRESDLTYGWNLRHNNGGAEGGGSHDRLVLEGLQGPTGTTPIMTWDQVTNGVGIGTTVPFTQLTNGASTTNVIGTDGNGVGAQSINWTNTTNGYVGGFYNSANVGNGNGLAVKVTNTGAAALDISQGAAVGTPGTSLLRVNSNGTVGIGTSGPTQALDVRGNVRLGADGGNVLGTGQNIEFVGPGYNTDPVGLYRQNVSNASTELRVVVGDDPTQGDTYADRFVVGTASASGTGQVASATFTPRFTVQGNGYVGVGTSTPAGGLHVTTGNVGAGSGVAGAVLSGLAGSPPYLELRGSGTGTTTTTPYLDFAETSDVDYTTRLLSSGGVLGVYGTGTNGQLLNVSGGVTVGNNLRRSVRLCPVNQTTPYALTATDITFDQFKVANNSYASSFTLPASGNGQVAGQELTIYSIATTGFTIAGTNTDNAADITVQPIGNAGLHAVKFVWDGAWIRIQ